MNDNEHPYLSGQESLEEYIERLEQEGREMAQADRERRLRRINFEETPEEFAQKLKLEAEEMAAREPEHRQRLRREEAARNYTGLLGKVREIVDKQRQRRGE